MEAIRNRYFLSTNNSIIMFGCGITGHLDAEEIEQAASVLGQTMGFLVSDDDIEVCAIGMRV